MFRRLLVIVFTSTALVGCTYHKIGAVESFTVDASERVVLTNNGAICAEPSPDAIKSIAETVALKVKDYGEVSQSYASTMASIGLRTAGVQILRDIGYRACEAYSNRAIGPDLYKELVEGADDAAVALVAVEGLTGIRAAPAVAISSSAAGSTSTTGTSGTSAITQPATINFNAAAGQPINADQTRSIACAVTDIVRAIVGNNGGKPEDYPPSTCTQSQTPK
jgi:hypothetical protein